MTSSVGSRRNWPLRAASRSDPATARSGSGPTFPQGRVTDHRINLTLYKLDKVLTGGSDEIVDALISDQAARLAAMQ